MRQAGTSSPKERRWALLLTALPAFLLPVAGCRSLSPRGAVPESVMTCRQLAQQASGEMERENWPQAELLLRQAIETCPTNAEARRHYARVLQQKGELEQAVVQLDKAIESDPDARTLVEAGLLLLAAGKTDQAYWRAERAIAEDPSLGSAWALRGEALARLGDADQALADLIRSLDHEPNNPQALLDIATIYHRRGQPRRVLATVQTLLDNCPEEQQPVQARFLQGLAYQSLGRYQDAVSSLTIASHSGRDPEVFYQLGRAQLFSGQRSAAALSLEKALALDRDHRPSRALLNQLHNELAQRSPANQPY